jgi:hypothetical protein
MPGTKAVNYDPGKMLTNRLSLLGNSHCVIKDSFDFIQDIQDIQQSTKTDKMMVLFDVTNFYTNVPLTFTIDYILDRMCPTCSGWCRKWPRTKQYRECTKRKDFEI